MEVVALKGAALAFFHYEEPALRPMGDLDLLLREPRDLERATAALVGAGWTALFDTPRHRVFARPDERVVRPASEHPENPIRSSSIRRSACRSRPCLRRERGAAGAGRVAGPRRHPRRGRGGAVAPDAPPLPRGRGLRGQRNPGDPGARLSLLARVGGAASGDFLEGRREGAGAAPLLYAADAIERLFPLTFEDSFSLLSLPTSARAPRRAAALPALRYTRPARGWTRTLLTLVDGPLPRARFLLRTLFPTLGEVKANVAPDASGIALAAAYVRVLARRVTKTFRI